MATKATNQVLLAARTLDPSLRTSLPVRLAQPTLEVLQTRSEVEHPVLHLEPPSHLRSGQAPQLVVASSDKISLQPVAYSALRHKPNPLLACLEVAQQDSVLGPQEVLVQPIRQAHHYSELATLPTSQPLASDPRQLLAAQALDLQLPPEDLVVGGCLEALGSSRTRLLHLASHNNSNSSNN